MVVDDSKTVRVTAEAILRKENCEVCAVENGFDALAQLVDFDPDIILLDIMMPRLDGYQTCTVIKHNPDYQATPVIFLSSMDGLFDKAKGRMAGAEEYLTKPFSKDELLNALEQQLAVMNQQSAS